MNLSQRTRFIELNHTTEDAMLAYKTPPAPVLRDHPSRVRSRQTHAEGTAFLISKSAEYSSVVIRQG